MLELIKTEDLQELKNDNLSVLMIYAEGCGVCQQAKPQFDILSNQFSDFSFFKAPLNEDTYEFYKKYELPEKKMVEKQTEDGTTITEEVEVYPIQIPKYYVFHKDNINEVNDFGFLGKVPGHNMDQLYQVLLTLSKQKAS